MGVTLARPDRADAAAFYFTYIDQVEGNDVLRVLQAQLADVEALHVAVSEERSLHRYAPDKWSMRQVMNHVNDAERLFAFRALWFARGLDAPLPGFDERAAAAAAAADERSWASHLDEFQSIRAGSLTLFQALPPGAWARRGMASGHSFTVNALAYITAGHAAHHLKILRDRYLVKPA